MQTKEGHKTFSSPVLHQKSAGGFEALMRNGLTAGDSPALLLCLIVSLISAGPPGSSETNLRQIRNG